MPHVPNRPAIDLALQARGEPELVSRLAAAPLPPGVRSLLHIAADAAWRDEATAHAYRRHSPQAVREASVALLSAILFSRPRDPYRVLGLAPGASRDEVRDHKRLLLKWLHPDSNPGRAAGGRERELLARVLDAVAEIEGRRAAPPRPAAGSQPPRANAKPPAGRSPGTEPRAIRTPAGQPRHDQVAAPEVRERGTKRAISRALDHSFRNLRRAAYAGAVVLAALVLWRYLMQEPIGLSLQRYSQAVPGLLSW